MSKIISDHKIHPSIQDAYLQLPEEVRNNPAFAPFMHEVNQGFKKFERDKDLLEHSHRISDMEYSEMNRKLQETTNRLKLATKAAGIGVWEWNAVTGNVSWDDYMYEIFGVQDREAFGSISANWFKLTHPEDLKIVNSKLSMLSHKSKDVNIEYRIIRPSDGSVRHIITNALITADHRNFLIQLVGTCMDITDIRTAEQEKAHLLADVLKQNKELEDFAFVISHRLRSHSSKLSTVSAIFTNKSTDEVLRNTLIDEVNKEAKLFDETLRELTEIIALSERKKVDTEPIDIGEFLQSCLANRQDEFTDSNIAVNISNEKGVVVLGVRGFIKNVFCQLIDNCVKFRSPERNLEINISVEVRGNKVKVHVQDNGIGIDIERHQNKLFGLYRKFHTHIEGKGIGLHLVKKQVELMGGEVEVFSTLNHGTTFIVNLQKA